MTSPASDVVITGMGLITCLGRTAETTWRGVLERRSGLRPMSALESPLPPGRSGGQAVELPADFMPRAAREVRYLRAAIDEALVQARVSDESASIPERCGCVFGTTLHGLRHAGDFLRTDDPSSLRGFLASSVLREATAGLEFRGPRVTTCSACSSGLGSIALGMTMLRAGQVDLVLAGGYDPVSEYVYAGFDSLRLVADGPLRPFCTGRDGMTIAEGYAVVVLERAADAARRGVDPVVLLRGYGESSDAHHLTHPHPEGEGAFRAIRGAMASAGLGPEGVGLIAAHATGTPGNDAAEFAALSRAFSKALPSTPVVAFKSHLGHTLGGAGAAELILSALALRDQIVPPTANVRTDELEFPAPLNTGEPRPALIAATLNTSLGFGGANACMVLTRTKTPRQRPRGSDSASEHAPSGTLRRDVLITGVGVVLPGAIGNEAFVARLAGAGGHGAGADAGRIDDAQLAPLLNARRVRRMSEYVKLTLAATSVACRDATIDDVPAFAATCAALLGTTHGSAGFSEAYYRQIVRDGMGAANPMLFAEGVPNAGSAQLSLMLQVKGPCQTIIGSRTAGLDALWLAALRIAGGEWDRAIVGAAEEYSEVVNRAYAHCGFSRRQGQTEEEGGFVAGSGAVTLVLESRDSASRRGVAPKGYVRVGAGASFDGGPRDGIEAVRNVVERIGSPGCVLGSASGGTWLDRIEARALGAKAAPAVGLGAETFSVAPLVKIGAVVLGGVGGC